MREKTILVAEDDRTARVSLVGLLEAEGFAVLSAETGTQAHSLLISKNRMSLSWTFECPAWTV